MCRYVIPWRRKLGVLTLLMACVAMTGWVRSQSVWDSFNLKIGKDRSLVLMSRNNGIVGMSVVDHVEGSVDFPFYVAWGHSAPEDDRPPTPDSGGFLFGTSVHQFPIATALYGQPTTWSMADGAVISFVGIPYWGAVIPLTLISAFLLLSKPVPANPKKPAESTPAVGT